MSHPISSPKLPPKEGYVEVEDSNGDRVYQKTETEQDKLITTLQAQSEQYDMLIFDMAYSITLLELGVI